MKNQNFGKDFESKWICQKSSKFILNFLFLSDFEDELPLSYLSPPFFPSHIFFFFIIFLFFFFFLNFLLLLSLYEIFSLEESKGEESWIRFLEPICSLASSYPSIRQNLFLLYSSCDFTFFSSRESK